MSHDSLTTLPASSMNRKSFGKFIIEPVLLADEKAHHSNSEEENATSPPFILHSKLSKESIAARSIDDVAVEGHVKDEEEEEESQFILVKKGSSPPVRRSFGNVVTQANLNRKDSGAENTEELSLKTKNKAPPSWRMYADSIEREHLDNTSVHSEHSKEQSPTPVRRSFGDVIVETNLKHENSDEELPPPPPPMTPVASARNSVSHDNESLPSTTTEVKEHEVTPISARRSFGDVIVETISSDDKYHSVKESSEDEEPPVFRHIPTPKFTPPQSHQVLEQLPKTTPIAKPAPLIPIIQQHQHKPASLTNISLSHDEPPTNQKPVKEPPKSVKDFLTLVKEESNAKKASANKNDLSSGSCCTLCLACISVSLASLACCKLFRRNNK